MFKKQVTPGTAAIAVILILAVIQFAYWRLLVYREKLSMRPGPMSGPPAATPLPMVGRQDVTVETAAGLEPGYQDGASWEARFCGPNALALDRDAGLLVVDSRNHRLRKIDAKGRVTTVAGGAAPGGPGDRSDGPALQAGFRFPSGVAVGPDGAIYLADTGNYRICRLRDGQVTTLAGGAPGLADGPLAAARFQSPGPLAFGPEGALWVADVGNRKVRRVDLAGTVSTPAAAPPVVAEALGELVPATRAPVLFAYADGNGELNPTEFTVGRQTAAAPVPGMPSVQVLGDPVRHVLLMRRGSEPPFLLAGRVGRGQDLFGEEDGTGHRCAFSAPCAVVFGRDGAAYVADYEGNRVRRVRLPAWLLAAAPAPAGSGFRSAASGS